MSRNERGQGLVEYALILVLVAIVVIGMLMLVGPAAIQDEFCIIVGGLMGPVEDVVTMDIDADSLDIDVDSQFNFPIGSVVTPPSHGTVEQYDDDTFIYLRYESEVGTGADDSFTFRYEGQNPDCLGLADWQYDYTVVIIVGEPDFSLSVASVMSDAEQTTLELDDAREQIMILWEEAKGQEEGLQEGVDFALEAVVEGFEVLVDFADDFNQQELSAGLSLLIQNIQSDDIGGIPEAIVALGSHMEDVPLEVWTAVSLEMAPSLIDSCEAVSGGLVSPETIAAAQEAVAQLDDDYPGKAVIQELLDEAVGIIEERDVFSQDWLEVICTAVAVDIDIRPGGDPNIINLGSSGVVPVAVLTTDDFDASTVDPAMVVFAGAWPLRWTIEDVDFDGDVDLLFHFKTQELDLDENSTEATLIGKTVDGHTVYGTDSVNIVP